MLVKSHNHCVNAAGRAIQNFKDHFISALATTDSNIPLQLWDRLAPQVKNALGMLCPSRINPNMLAYEAVHGPYNWNGFLLRHLGVKWYALGLLANLKETRKVKRVCRVEATSIRSVLNK
jgi:hypothetical protein